MLNINVLSTVCYLAAVAAAGVYVYGYVIKSKGDRRWHTAGLLFAGLAMINLPPVLQNGAQGLVFLNALLLVLFMLASLACQAVTALRGRRADRRADDRAPAAPGIAPQAQ